jgi:hypothetical protein
MIYTTPWEMFFMRADTLRGQVGEDWDLEMESFFGPVKWHQPIGECHLGPKKLTHMDVGITGA